MFKIFIIALFISVVLVLFLGLFFLMKDPEDSKRTVKALFLRVSLSALLIAAVWFGIYTGSITPHGVGG